VTFLRQRLPYVRHSFSTFVAVVALAITLVNDNSIPSRRVTAADVTSKPLQFNFTLPATTGQNVSLTTASPAKLRVLCFLGCDCPVAKLYGPRLKTLAQQFASQGVEFIGINSNPQDSPAKFAQYASDHELTFPMLKDHDGQVAATMGASRTPEVMVIGSLGQIVYQGRVDDQYRPGVVTDAPTRDDLRIAIEEYLAGQAVSVPLTTAAGCRIAKRRPVDPDSEVTFARDISRILNRHCVECHRSGEIGPFALTDYEEIVGWADMIVEVVEEKRMPPWHADDNPVPLANTRQMSDNEKKQLQQWVQAGVPFGDASDLPTSESYASGWQIGQPDLIIPMASQPFVIPAGGTVEYQYFVIDPGFTEDRWVAAAEIIPGNRAVVHHGIAFIRPPDGIRVEGLGWLTAYVPGQRMPHPVTHRARRVPAGSKIVFQMHYTPTGKVEHDLSQVGLSFARPEDVTEELLTLVGINQAIEIPPGQPRVAVHGQTDSLPAGSRLLALAPHMHLRGKSFQVRQRTGDKQSIVLDVPHYDFNWQHTYILQDPIPLDSIDSLDFTATYDNSTENPFNPDPEDFVTWGDQTWEEMALVFYEVARPAAANDRQSTSALRANRSTNTQPETNEAKESKRALATERFFEDLDRDRDGVIGYDEVDRAVQLRLFRRFDTNGDRIITREEVAEHLKNRSLP